MNENGDLFSVLCIMGASCLVSTFVETVSYFLIYRKEDYKALCKNMEAAVEKVQKLEEKITPSQQNKQLEKKITLAKGQLTALNQELSMMRMKTHFLLALIMIATISSLGTHFAEIVVARLPFEPFFIFKSIFHRGLIGENFTECSYLPFYIMTSFVIRGNIHKFFGTSFSLLIHRIEPAQLASRALNEQDLSLQRTHTPTTG